MSSSYACIFSCKVLFCYWISSFSANVLQQEASARSEMKERRRTAFSWRQKNAQLRQVGLT